MPVHPCGLVHFVVVGPEYIDGVGESYSGSGYTEREKREREETFLGRPSFVTADKIARFANKSRVGATSSSASPERRDLSSIVQCLVMVGRQSIAVCSRH